MKDDPGAPRTPPPGLIRAQRWCRWLPPLLAQRVRERVYPRRDAYRDAYPFVARARTGGLLAGSTADYHGYPFSVHGFFAWRHVAVAIALCRRRDTVVEIGSNVGTETVSLADVVGHGGRLFAFEPVSEHCRTLDRMVRLNGFEQVEIWPTAVGDTHSPVTFDLPSSPHTSGTGHIRGPAAGTRSDATADTQTVDCTTLDDLADRLGPARMVFVDAEGAELAILRGGRRYLRIHAPHLVLEASARHLERSGGSLGALYSELTDLGYTVHRIGRLGLVCLASAAAAEAHSRSKNWLCLRTEPERTALRAQRIIRRIGLLPAARGLNPLVRSRSGVGP